MKSKKDVKKIMEGITQAKCSYPECDKKNMITVSLPIISDLESGQIEASEGMALGVPFCNYHSFIAMSGHFGIKTDPKGEKNKLFAPFPMITLIESVIHAREMDKNIEEELKKKKIKNV